MILLSIFDSRIDNRANLASSSEAKVTNLFMKGCNTDYVSGMHS